MFISHSKFSSTSTSQWNRSDSESSSTTASSQWNRFSQDKTRPYISSRQQSHSFLSTVNNHFGSINDSLNVDFTSCSVVHSASSMILGSDFEPSQTFEPQVNTPALFSFLIIAVVFSLLQFRINSVRDASLRRAEALTFLREVKSEQLDFSNNKVGESNMNNNGVQSTIDGRVQDAIEAYETALKEELKLRTIVPGVRIVAPNDAARREEDIAAAKQFLDWDILADEKKQREESTNNKYDSSRGEIESESSKKSLLMQSRRRFDGQEGSNSSPTLPNEEMPMSNTAKAILLTVAVSQIGLLFLLSLDPMSANTIFTDIAGNPTEGLPLSSWTNN